MRMIVCNRRIVLIALILLGVFALAVQTVTADASVVRKITDGEERVLSAEEWNNTSYFKFTAKHHGELEINNPGIVDDGNYDKVYFKKNGKYKLLGYDEFSDPGDNLIVFEGKTYYIKAGKVSEDYWGDDDVSICVKTHYRPDGGDKKSHAKRLKLNENIWKVGGYITYHDGASDWYKFTIKKKQKVSIQILHQNEYNTKQYNKLTLYKGKRKMGNTKSYRFRGTYLADYRLGKGTYYIKITRGDRAINGRYQIALVKYGKRWAPDDEEDEYAVYEYKGKYKLVNR